MFLLNGSLDDLDVNTLGPFRTKRSKQITVVLMDQYTKLKKPISTAKAIPITDSRTFLEYLLANFGVQSKL